MSYIGDYHDAIATMIRRGRLSEIDDSGSQQLVTVKGVKGETLEKVQRFQMPGLSHNPPSGNEGFLLALGGRSDRAVFLGGESEAKRPRSTVAGGSVLYDETGNIIYAKMGDGVYVKAEAGTVTVERGAMKVVVSANRVDLGGTGGSPVLTVAGPSSKVFAIL